MGKRKRILLLALLIIVSGKTYSVKNGEVNAQQNITTGTGNWADGGTVTVTESGEVNVSGAASGAGIKNGGTVTNNGEINVSEANSKGLNFGSGGGTAENNNKITATGEGIGVYFGATGEFVNNSTGVFEIKGNNSKGIYLNSQNTIAENKGVMTVGGTDQTEKGAIGIQVNNASAEFTNESGGTIESIGGNSKGIQINIGTAENKGSIQATEGASGVYVNGASGSFYNNLSGEIVVSGTNSKGIHFGSSKGTAENSGTISVTEKGIGTYFGGNGTFTNKESGKIQVTGTDSKGIYLNSQGTATNEGIITVGGIGEDEAGAIGVQVNNASAKFTNESNGTIESIGGNSKGIQVNNGKAVNSGKIQATEGASGIYVHGASGSFINNSVGKIVASGASSKGIFFGSNGGTAENTGTIEVSDGASGVFFYQGTNNNFTNNSNGKINVTGERSVGLLLNAKGTAENKGTITVNGGKGVVLGGSTFTNTGTIDAGEDGIAIESSAKTNNTLILKSENTFRNITSGSSITGKIVGNTGVDVLVLDNASYSGLNISGYENISVINGNNSNISDSVISLGYNAGTADYLSNLGITSSGDLSINNSSVVIDLANQAAGIPLVSADNLVLAGDIKLAFTSTNGQKEFNLKDMLGGVTLDVGSANFGSTAVWEYKIDSDGNLKVV